MYGSWTLWLAPERRPFYTTVQIFYMVWEDLGYIWHSTIQWHLMPVSAAMTYGLLIRYTHLYGLLFSVHGQVPRYHPNCVHIRQTLPLLPPPVVCRTCVDRFQTS